MEPSMVVTLCAELKSRAPSGLDWERNPEWALRQVRALERKRAIRAAFVWIVEFFRRPTPALRAAGV